MGKGRGLAGHAWQPLDLLATNLTRIGCAHTQAQALSESRAQARARAQAPLPSNRDRINLRLLARHFEDGDSMDRVGGAAGAGRMPGTGTWRTIQSRLPVVCYQGAALLAATASLRRASSLKCNALNLMPFMASRHVLGSDIILSQDFLTEVPNLMTFRKGDTYWGYNVLFRRTS